MRGAGWMMVGLILGLGAAEATGYTIVRKDGTTFEVRTAPAYEDGQVTFELAGGSPGSIPEDAVDKAATERANQPSDTTETGGGGAVFTNEALESSSEGDAPAVFTNEDLENAKGLSTVEGSVQAEGAGTLSEAEWAARHDAEMAEREQELASRMTESEARIKELEERVVELKRQLAEVDPSYTYVAGDRAVDQGAVVAEHRRIAAELTEAERELAEARGE